LRYIQVAEGVSHTDSSLPRTLCWALSKHIFSFLFFAVLGFELRAYTLSYSTSPFFVMGSFEIGSLKLFAQGANQTKIFRLSAS
jgi:hypothetical protein